MNIAFKPICYGNAENIYTNSRYPEDNFIGYFADIQMTWYFTFTETNPISTWTMQSGQPLITSDSFRQLLP